MREVPTKVETKEGFVFDYFHCLRSEYARNACSLCIDLCPEEAMVFDRKRLTLDVNRCTSCGACMGICPTQAFVDERFDPQSYIDDLIREEGNLLTCRSEGLSCLAVFGVEHFIGAALASGRSVLCDLSACDSCTLNRKRSVLSAIDSALDEANRFLESVGAKPRLIRSYDVAEVPTVPKKETVDESRRRLFGRLGAGADKNEDSSAQKPIPRPDNEKREPPRRPWLKSIFKSRMDGFEKTKVEEPFAFVSGKSIDSMACTNCQECAMFCPTGALTTLQDNTGIVFAVGKCIHCGICNDVCRPDAITSRPDFDLVDFAFDRLDLLVKHTLEFCEECKVAFPYKGGEKVCDRCRDFKNNYSDLFTMAKDL